jgi:adenylate cyclase
VRGAARWCLGLPGWRADLDEARSTSMTLDTQLLTGVLWFTYVMAVPYGVLLTDIKAMKVTADALVASEQSGDDFAVDLARMARGVVLFHHDGPDRATGLGLLTQVRNRALTGRFSLTSLPIADLHNAMEAARSGDPDCAIRLAGDALDDLSRLTGSIWIALATQTLVDALLRRRGDGDLDTAEAAVDRLAAVPTDPGFVLNEITVLRLRALTARAAGDDACYRHCRDRYRKMAADLVFEGHMAWAEAMP